MPYDVYSPPTPLSEKPTWPGLSIPGDWHSSSLCCSILLMSTSTLLAVIKPQLQNMNQVRKVVLQKYLVKNWLKETVTPCILVHLNLNVLLTLPLSNWAYTTSHAILSHSLTVKASLNQSSYCKNVWVLFLGLNWILTWTVTYNSQLILLLHPMSEWYFMYYMFIYPQ